MSGDRVSNPNEPIRDEAKPPRQTGEVHYNMNSDDAAHLPPRKRYTESLRSSQQAEQEKEAVVGLEGQLPRPDWYSSTDEDASEMSEDEEEVSDLKSPDEGGIALLIVYTVLCLIAFVLSLAATCPIPWMKGKDWYKGREFGIWKADKGPLPELTVRDIHDCGQEKQYWQAASAFAVITTIFTFGALVSGVLQVVGMGHIGSSFILGMYSAAFSLVSWALVAALFHYHRCGKGTYASIANLDAGFALMIVVFILMIAAMLVLAVHFFKTYTRSIHGGKPNNMRFVYLAALCVTAIFNCVGPAFTQWRKEFPLVKVKVTMWRVELYDKQTQLSTYLSRLDYQCSTITRRMKVVAAFNVMSNIWLFFAILFAVGACYVKRMHKSSVMLGFATVVFSCVAWLTLVATRYGHLCTSQIPAGVSYWTDLGYNGIPSGYDNGQIVFDGYAMGEGFGLMVAAFAVSLVATILNCIF